jgi:hypothetical protein
MRRFIVAALGLVLLGACGGGGGGSDTGNLDVINRSSTLSGINCGLVAFIEPVGGGDVRTLTVGPCNSQALALDPGEYNVIASGQTFCQNPFVQTVTVREGESTPVFLECPACGGC